MVVLMTNMKDAKPKEMEKTEFSVKESDGAGLSVQISGDLDQIMNAVCCGLTQLEVGMPEPFKQEVRLRIDSALAAYQAQRDDLLRGVGR